MDRIRTKFIIAVTNRLAQAADSNAKTDLIEELSENLYQRWLDLTASGLSEDEAYEKALEDLGDVDELLDYLGSLGPEGELPRQEAPAGEKGFKDFADDLTRSMEEIVRETISQTKDAVDQAKVIVRDVSRKLKEKYPHGFEGHIHLHFDDDEAAEHEGDEDCEYTEDTETAKPHRDKVYGIGYDKKKGGFFAQWGEYKGDFVEDTTFPSKELKAVDIQLTNGDVTVSLTEDPEADVVVDGDVEQLELRVSEAGVLSIRQGKTASSSFFFGRGLASADVELTLPRRFWEFLQIGTINGDVTVEDGLEAAHLIIRTTSGDIEVGQAACSQFTLQSVSGDIITDGIVGGAQANTTSGDIDLVGSLGEVSASSLSGDVTVTGSIQTLSASTTSGDIRVDTDVAPLQLTLSSKSGDCDVTMPEGLGFVLQYETVSGELRSDFGMVGPIGARSGEAIYLDGGERRYTISSISGDICLERG